MFPLALALLLGGSPAAPPATLLTAKAPITAFAQDGGRMAWASSCKVYSRGIGGGKTVILGGTSGPCFENGSWLLAIGGRRAVWGGYHSTSSNNRYGVILTGATGAKAKDVLELEQVERMWGDFATGVAGDGSTLVYANVFVRQFDGPDCPPCFFRVVGSPLRRVVGARSVTIPGTPPAVAVAAAAGRVAVVPANPAETFCCDVEPVPVRSGPVQVRNAVSGALVSSFTPSGTVRAVALTASEAAVLVADAAGEKFVERYRVASGVLLGRTPVPRPVADRVAMGSGRIVMREGREILALDTRNGERDILAITPSAAIDFSVEGRRVSWAENVRIRGRLRGRIRSLLMTP